MPSTGASDSASIFGGIAIQPRTEGYQFKVMVGWPVISKARDWQASFIYRYLERDAVLAEFTDSDFHQGGTDAKGYLLKFDYGVADNTWVTLRWISSDEIDGNSFPQTTGAGYRQAGHRHAATGYHRQILGIVMAIQYRQTIGLLLACLALHAGADEAGAQKALAKAQFLLRQATGQNTELQQQVDTLKAQVAALTQKLDESKTAAATRQQNAELHASETAAKWRDGNDKLAAQVAQLRGQLELSGRQNAELEQKLHAQSDNFSLCYANNKKLYDINRDLLEQYARKGVLAAVKQSEPFTGIERVKVENLVQDYQYKLDDLRVPSNSAME